MIQPSKKKKYPALEDEPFAIPDLSQMGNITALAGGSGRLAPTDTTSGSADNVVQFPPLTPDSEPPNAGQIPDQFTPLTPDSQPFYPENQNRSFAQYPSLAAEIPFQAQAAEPQAAPVKQLSPLEQAQGEYEKAVVEPAHKQGKAAQIANFALQFIADAFTPGEHQYEWLGNRKKQNRVDQAARTLAPLQAQETYKQKMAAGNADIAARNAQTADIARRPEKERDALKAKIEGATVAHGRRMDLRKLDADIKSGEAKLETDENGMQWKVFLTPDSTGKLRDKEPLVDPTTGQQEFDPGEQVVTDPLTGQRVKAKQILQPQAMIASSDANREQDIRKANESNRLKVDQENISKDIDWQKDNTKQLTDAITAENLGGDAEIAGWRREAEEKARQYEQISAGGRLSSPDRVKDLNKINDEILALNTQVLKAMEKTETGKAKAAALRQNMRKRPARLVYTPIEAVKVGGQMPNVSVDVFTQRLVANGVKDPAQQRALIAKARADGVIK